MREREREIPELDRLRVEQVGCRLLIADMCRVKREKSRKMSDESVNTDTQVLENSSHDHFPYL